MLCLAAMLNVPLGLDPVNERQFINENFPSEFDDRATCGQTVLIPVKKVVPHAANGEGRVAITELLNRDEGTDFRGCCHLRAPSAIRGGGLGAMVNYWGKYWWVKLFEKLFPRLGGNC